MWPQGLTISTLLPFIIWRVMCAVFTCPFCEQVLRGSLHNLLLEWADTSKAGFLAPMCQSSQTEMWNGLPLSLKLCLIVKLKRKNKDLQNSSQICLQKEKCQSQSNSAMFIFINIHPWFCWGEGGGRSVCFCFFNQRKAVHFPSTDFNPEGSSFGWRVRILDGRGILTYLKSDSIISVSDTKSVCIWFSCNFLSPQKCICCCLAESLTSSTDCLPAMVSINH